MRLWFSTNSDVPIYRQLATQVTLAILSGDLRTEVMVLEVPKAETEVLLAVLRAKTTEKDMTAGNRW